MNEIDVVALLRGESAGLAYGLTWIPEDVLLAVGESSGVDRPPDALVAVALAYDLDLVCVQGEADWAKDAVAALSDHSVESCWITEGVLGRVAARIGWSKALELSASEPGELAVMLDEALHDALSNVRRARTAGARVLLIADELAGASGWLVSPDFVLEALMPCYRRIAGEWRTEGSALAFHSDGDIRALLGPLKKAGMDSIHFGSPGTSSLEASVTAARAVGLCPMGGVDVRGLAEHGARRSGEQVARLAHVGGMVIADDGGMTGVEELAAYGAALDAARQLAEHQF